MFGDKLRTLRIRKGYSMDVLCKMYNERFGGKMNKSTMSRYENNLQTPMFTVVKNLAELLNISIDELSEESVGKRFDITNEEKEIIESYRKAPPEVQKMIKKMTQD